jgi:hypothetical protein
LGVACVFDDKGEAEIMNWMKQLGLAVGVSAAALATGGQAAAFPCEKEIRTKLADINIPKPSIASIRVIKDLGEDDIFLGYEVWTRVRSCKGQYILSLTDSCYIMSGHSRLSCTAGSGPSIR